jgi:uncharacterized lipoprotein YmbA
MKFNLRPFLLFYMILAGIFLAGCAWRPMSITTRHFILTPITANDSTPLATDRLSVGIGTVKMPTYLLRDSLAVRSGTNEIEYFESASWAERLDHCFQQTLAANLSKLLNSDRIYTTDWAHDQVMVCLYVNVQQFDVDTSGCGTLVAQWRINTPDSDKPLKSRNTKLTQSGSSPRGHPEAVVATLNDLTDRFSREVAQAVVESTKSGE